MLAHSGVMTPYYFCRNAGGHTSIGVGGDLNAEGLKPLLRLPVPQLQAKPDKSDDRPGDSEEVAWTTFAPLIYSPCGSTVTRKGEGYACSVQVTVTQWNHGVCVGVSATKKLQVDSSGEPCNTQQGAGDDQRFFSVRS